MAAHTLSLSTPTTSTGASYSQHNYRLPNSFPPSLTQILRPQSLQSPWLGTTKIFFQSCSLITPLSKHRPIKCHSLVQPPHCVISLSLSLYIYIYTHTHMYICVFEELCYGGVEIVMICYCSKPERVSSTEIVPKWSSKAIKSFAMGELEARKLKYPTTGTEALLMGILIEGTNVAAKFLLANGISIFKVREETIKLLGKGDMYYFSPEHPPLTESAQRALDWAVDEKLKSGGSLADKLKNSGHRSLPESEVRRHTESILKGLQCIHENGFVHCDLKLQNVLLCQNDVAKIADFGLAKKSGEKIVGFELRGTPMYMPPETVVVGQQQAAADVWALGCLVAEMVAGTPPWRCSAEGNVCESGEITPTHLLLGVWSEKESAGHKIMAALGFNEEKAKELETLISKPGSVED
ncbi:hypothetical protein HYC85_007282 [Camellia sinensis]|uniref:Protein kinase domain-containing protein n=1 Tax=Camellia sinensis TaxID=4442 RepID=A0A7J7HQV2_CAMSI|nr:hypothetical protein HYC85_007282 [Camellia sinensis]